VIGSRVSSVSFYCPPRRWTNVYTESHQHMWGKTGGSIRPFSLSSRGFPVAFTVLFASHLLLYGFLTHAPSLAVASALLSGRSKAHAFTAQ
jgi:hypothetical protein